MVVLGLEISLGAVGIARMAVDSRASLGDMGRLNSEAVLGEHRIIGHVNAAHVPVDGIAVLGVLELEHILLLLGGRELDANTTAVVVGAPAFLVVSTARREGMHVTDSISDRPRVDGRIQVVDDVDASTIAADNAAVGGSGKRGAKGGQGGNGNDLGEKHCGFGKD